MNVGYEIRILFGLYQERPPLWTRHEGDVWHDQHRSVSQSRTWNLERKLRKLEFIFDMVSTQCLGLHLLLQMLR